MGKKSRVICYDFSFFLCKIVNIYQQLNECIEYKEVFVVFCNCRLTTYRWVFSKYSITFFYVKNKRICAKVKLKVKKNKS